MLRRLLLLGLALCGTAHAAAPPRIELSLAPAWHGWSRPGRITEIDVRLSSDGAIRATLELVGGSQSVRSELDLQPGRVVRLYLPVSAAERVSVSAVAAAAATVRREVGIAKSESPLLGVALATGEQVRLEGFHSVALAAQDLPHNPSAYSSIDALILDAATLSALDQSQLGALLSHAAGCGRIVVVNTDARVRRLLDGAGGCGGRTLMSAVSPAGAVAMLEASLASSIPAAMTLGGVGELIRPGHSVWNRVAVALAAYFAVAVLALLLLSSWQVQLLTSALAAAAAVALLHVMQAPSQLVIWSEGESGAPAARYQAWQQVQGVVRQRARVPIPPQLAPAAQSCEPARAMHFDFDADRGHVTFAEFDTRLFGQVSLCYSGSFPVARAVAVATRADGLREIRNAGTKAWPQGLLLSGGLVHDLPALGPGAAMSIGAQTGKPLRDAVVRTAVTRTRADGVAALWELELGGVAGVPIESRGWLLISVPSP